MPRTSFDFDVITGPSAKHPEDQRRASERKDWNIAASLRTADPAAAPTIYATANATQTSAKIGRLT